MSNPDSSNSFVRSARAEKHNNANTASMVLQNHNHIINNIIYILFLDAISYPNAQCQVVGNS